MFVGRVPKPSSESMAGGEASIISSRLRSREDPDQGIDLSNGFAGFILRLVSDGNKYEAENQYTVPLLRCIYDVGTVYYKLGFTSSFLDQFSSTNSFKEPSCHELIPTIPQISKSDASMSSYKDTIWISLCKLTYTVS